MVSVSCLTRLFVLATPPMLVCVGLSRRVFDVYWCSLQVIISAQAHKLVKGHCTTMEVFTDSYCRVIKEPRYTPMRKQNKVNMLQQTLDDPLLEVKVKGYIPGAVLRNLRPDSPEDEHWSNEVWNPWILRAAFGLLCP